MRKWKAVIEQNGGEYSGWVTFYADNVYQNKPKVLLVDSREMEFDEKIISIQEVNP